MNTHYPLVIFSIFIATVLSFGAIYSLLYLSEYARDTFLAHQYFLFVTPFIYVGIILCVRQFAQPITGSGIPQTLLAKDTIDTFIPSSLLTFNFAMLKVIFVSLATLFGAPLGIGGPSIYIGAALFYNCVKLFKITSQNILYSMIIIGSSSGIIIVFNAPLAGVSFALEEMYRYSKKHYLGVIMLAIVLVAGVDYLIQPNPYMMHIFVSLQEIQWELLPLIIIVSSSIGAVFVKGSLALISLISSLKIINLAIIALILGGIVSGINYLSDGLASGGGKDEAMLILSGEHLGPQYLIYKLSIVFSSLVSTIPGGIFIPSVSIGASVGDVLASVIALYSETNREWIILLTMTSYLSSISRTPITAAFIITEITASYLLLPVALVVALLSNLLTSIIEPRPLYYELAKRLVK